MCTLSHQCWKKHLVVHSFMKVIDFSIIPDVHSNLKVVMGMTMKAIIKI